MLSIYCRGQRTASSKFCSHLATSELSKVLTRSKEPALSLIRPFGGCSILPSTYMTGETSRRLLSTSSTVEGLYGGGPTFIATESTIVKQKSKPTTIPKLNIMHRKNKPITMITAYDYTSGLLCDKAGADILLVGDSVGMVVLGHDTTVPVTMDDMVHHIKAVRRATERPLIVGDMPFGSYLDPQSAAQNACRLIKEGGCDAVKLEGGKNMVSRVRAITENGMAVQGHIGLLPQHISSIGGYRVQGKNSVDAVRLLEDALALQEAGCFSIVLEMVPDEVAHAITLALDIPTIGIGAGPRTSGQVQVFHDVVGLYDKLIPKFSKRYATLGDTVEHAVGQYCEEVRGHEFPTLEQHTFTMPSKQLSQFQSCLATNFPHVFARFNNDIMMSSKKNNVRQHGVTEDATKDEQERAQIASSLIAEQWRRKMIQAYHQEALSGAQRATSMRYYSSLAAVEKHMEDDEYASYRNTMSSSSVSSPLIVKDAPSLRKARQAWNAAYLSSEEPTVGFVPTMGALHAGHLELVRKAKIENDIVIVSIYINPTQFAAHEDLDVYPRHLAADIALLEELGVDVVYAPTKSLYDADHQTWVVPDIDGQYDEGKARPGFFRGVATVVTKLLNHVQPNVAYFGQKDAQQCAVIQDLVRDLDIGASVGEHGMRIDIVPTVRESDGLAMSSRNAYLSTEERAMASALFEALSVGRQRMIAAENQQPGDCSLTVGEIRQDVLGILAKRGIDSIEYVTVADVRTTKPMSNDNIFDKASKDGQYMIATAIKIGKTRLIDNIVV